MSSEDKDPLERIAKGAAKGALEWTEEKIKELIAKFKDKDLAFIKDDGTIQLAKELLKKGEFTVFARYVPDRKLRTIFQMGLTLRHIEQNEKDKLKLEKLQSRIQETHQTNGLHGAYFVQNGIFPKYFSNILEKTGSEQQISQKLTELFSDIDRVTEFIQKTDQVNHKTKKITSKVYSNSPDTFVISSSRTEAIKRCVQIKTKVMTELEDSYECERFESKHKGIFFLNRKEQVF